jgi:hypothetical protein
MSRFEKNDIEWAAFCYVTDELNESDHEQFESLLASDQDAREALARAVELGQTISAAQCIELKRNQNRPNGKSAAIAVGFVVASVLGFLVITLDPWGQPAMQPPIIDSAADPALALAWSQSQTEYDENSSDLEDELAVLNEFAEHELDSDDSPLDAPLWMLTAVSVQQKALEESKTVEMEN